MKKQFIIFLLFALSTTVAMAQADPDTKELALKRASSNVLDQVKLDFSVPDMPAFKALGKDPSNLLRPSSAKDIALAIGNFRSSGSTIIPKNFSLEGAPGLFKPWYTLEDYQKKGMVRFLTKARVSIGSDMNDETGVNSLAAGLRFTLLDNSDFRKDSEFLSKKIFDKQDKHATTWKRVRDEIIIKRGMKIFEFADTTEAIRNEINAEARRIAEEEIGFDLDTIIDNAIEEFKKKNWNASRIDFAYSVLTQSPDTLLENVKVQKHLFWLAVAFKPGKNNTWGQFLFGVNNNVVRISDKYYNEFNGNFRFYAGGNRFKGFIEAQYQYLDNPTKKMETLYTQVGAELAIYKSVWIHFGTGILNALDGDRSSQLQGNLNLYFSFPEDLKLF